MNASPPELRELRMLLCDHSTLFIVYIEDVQLSGTISKDAFEVCEESIQQNKSKGIEEKEEARSRRNPQTHDVVFHQGHLRRVRIERLPVIQVFVRRCRKRGMQLHTDDSAEGILCCEQHGAALACADVHEGGLLQWMQLVVVLPALEQLTKEGWRCTVIRRDVPVMRMARRQIIARDKRTGVCAMKHVEGMWWPGSAAFTVGARRNHSTLVYLSRCMELAYRVRNR